LSNSARRLLKSRRQSKLKSVVKRNSLKRRQLVNWRSVKLKKERLLGLKRSAGKLRPSVLQRRLLQPRS